jgi:hypothetical protein
MRSMRLRASLALALAAFTAACGDSGSTGPSFADSVSTVVAEGFADGSAETATYLAQNLNFGAPSIGAASQAMFTRIMARPEVIALRANMSRPVTIAPIDAAGLAMGRPAGIQLADGCTFSGHGMYDIPFGDPVDLNENGLADDASVDIVCIQTEEGGGDTLWTYRQDFHIAMKEIAGSVYGATFSAWQAERYSNNHGYFEEQRLDQSGKIDLRTSSASTDQKMKFSGAYSEGNHEGAEHAEGAIGEEWSADFDADAAIVYGSDLPDGDLTLNGRSYAYEEPSGNNISFSISTPTALAYNAACAAVPTNPPFTAGVLLGELNGSSNQASFEVTFTSCGNYTIDVDGAYDEVVVSAQR